MKMVRHYARSPGSDGKRHRKMEENKELTFSEGNKTRRMKELGKQFDCEFEEHHVQVLNFIVAEDTAALESA